VTFVGANRERCLELSPLFQGSRPVLAKGASLRGGEAGDEAEVM
jgi:hypothetical protein